MSVRSLEVRCVILGGGGHAIVLIDSLLSMGGIDIAGVLDARKKPGHDDGVLGIPVLGGDMLLPRLKDKGVTHFVLGLAGTGPNPLREKLWEQALSHGLKPLSVIHPSVVLSQFSTIGDGVQIFPHSVVNAGASVGQGCIVNTGAIVEHDAIMEPFSHLSSGARIAGGVRLGRHAFVGSGATVIQGVSIGRGALVGAGAVALHDVGEDDRVVGVPARSIRKSS
ncbi:MAG: acetyltransferase [Verrucomicrobia bacterium]|nr:acetyltransferase [Verrucomicrobiota bacterium]